MIVMKGFMEVMYGTKTRAHVVECEMSQLKMKVTVK